MYDTIIRKSIDRREHYRKVKFYGGSKGKKREKIYDKSSGIC